MSHFNDIDGTDGTGFRTDGIKIAHHLLLIGNGHIESFQRGVGVEYLCQILDGRNLEVDVSGIDTFVLKLLVEIILREGVP